MTPFSEVITALIEKYGGNKAEIARKLKGKDEFDISGQLLGMYARGERKPKNEFYERWKSVFGDDIADLMKQNVSHETIVETNNEIPATVYKDLVESKTDYRLFHKSVLEEYRMVPLPKMEQDNRNVDSQNRVIEKLLSTQEKLLNRIAQLETQAFKIK